MVRNSPGVIWDIPDYARRELREKHSEYCICIPVINEGERIKKQLSQMQQYADSADIILCDGGSTDGSMDPGLLKKYGVSTLLVKKGPGKLSAQLRMGYSYALKRGYKGMITIDGNNKDGVDAIPSFIQSLKDGYDFVQGSRFVKGGKAEHTPLSRLVGIKLIHAPVISLLAHFHYTDTTNGFRGYSEALLRDERIQPFREIFSTYELLPYLAVQAPRRGYKVVEIPVTRSYPKSGAVPTKISPWKGSVELLDILWKLARGVYNS